MTITRTITGDKVMKLYYLERTETCGYDETQAFVVRAFSAREAREIASKNSGQEEKEVWLSCSESTCRSLKQDGKAGVILQDFKAG